jgi:hypothetical protein
MKRFPTVLWLTALAVVVSRGCVQAQDTTEPGQKYAVQEVDDLMRENFEQYNQAYQEAYEACAQQLLLDPSWDWYWTRKAYLDPALPYLPCVRGDDVVSRMVAPVAQVGILMWNSVMAVDAVRAGLLVVCVGMLLGVGAKLVKAV